MGRVWCCVGPDCTFFGFGAGFSPPRFGSAVGGDGGAFIGRFEDEGNETLVSASREPAGHGLKNSSSQWARKASQSVLFKFIFFFLSIVGRLKSVEMRVGSPGEEVSPGGMHRGDVRCRRFAFSWESRRCVVQDLHVYIPQPLVKL